MRNLPRPGLEPVSPALAGGFLTTAPPGKPSPCVFLFVFCFFFKKTTAPVYFFIFFNLFNLWLCWVFVSVRGLSLVAASGATLHRDAWASHYRGLSCCGAQAPDAQAQKLWLTGLVAPRYVGSSQTRARTRVPCIGRQILNHCATREALSMCF